MDWLVDPQAWIAFVTLLALEIVLGIDNIVFISILADKLPANQQAKARYVGLGLAMLMRIYPSLFYIVGNPPHRSAFYSFSRRDFRPRPDPHQRRIVPDRKKHA
jgi:hypothetical protein